MSDSKDDRNLLSAGRRNLFQALGTVAAAVGLGGLVQSDRTGVRLAIEQGRCIAIDGVSDLAARATRQLQIKRADKGATFD